MRVTHESRVARTNWYLTIPPTWTLLYWLNVTDWTLPTEAFPIRHEILDRSPPPEQFSQHHRSVNYSEEAHSVQVEDHLPGMLTNMKPCIKLSWDPSSVVIDSLNHYATLGDIQTVACILMVLGDSRKFLKGWLTTFIVRQFHCERALF